MKAKKSLGQNFLINDTIITDIVSLFCVNKNDLILEIGPGRGALTKELIKLESHLLCIEIDTDLKDFLSPFESDKCHIIFEDILKVDLQSILANYKYDNLYIIGNLPYYITSPIMEHIIKSNIAPKEMAFMVQKEVANRYSAKVGTKDYGYMTLFLDYYFNVTTEIFVAKNNFNPIPKVDSAVIRLTKKNNTLTTDVEGYFAFLKTAFSLKRKTLKNNLVNYDWNIISNVLKSNDIKENARAEEISQDVFIQIYNELRKE